MGMIMINKEQHNKYMRDYRKRKKEEDPEYLNRVYKQMKKWRENNPDKWKRIQQNYYERNKDKIKLRLKKWREQNREKIRQRQHNYYQKNKEEIDERRRKGDKKRRMKTRIKVLSHYGNKCACCGETETKFLTIDHIKGGGYKHRKKIRVPFYYWLIKNDFPEGFQVLCMNCNFAKGMHGECPHETKNKIPKT